MKLKYNFVINDVAGETVAVSVGGNADTFNGYLKLNETGAFIFKMLKKDTTKEEIINALSKEYPDADMADITESVDTLVEKLEKAEMLV